MSGGGSKQPAQKAAPAPVPEREYQNVPGAMPGQIGLLSEQLAAGFGGKPSDFEGLLAELYKDQKIPIGMPGPGSGANSAWGSYQTPTLVNGDDGGTYDMGGVSGTPYYQPHKRGLV